MQMKVVGLIVLAAAIAGCNPGSESASEATPASTELPQQTVAQPAPVAPAVVAAPVVQLPSNEVVEVTMGQGGHEPLPMIAGQSISGPIDSPRAGAVVGLDIFIGNYRNTSDGQLEVQLCVAGMCEAGVGELLSSKDNRFLTLALNKPLAIEKGPLEYKITKIGGDKRVAIWVNQTVAPGNPLTAVDGSKVERVPRIKLRYAKGV